MTPRIESGIHIWTEYWGALLNDGHGKTNSIIYGFENESPAHIDNRQASIADTGACFGFVASGRVAIQDKRVNW